MKILFSPSEAKFSGGSFAPFDKNSFVFEQLFEKRLEIVYAYQRKLTESSLEELSVFFGLKDIDEVRYFQQIDLTNTPSDLAISRYDGVAYTYLDFASLPAFAKEFVLENTLIFSNLFGPIRAKDLLPEYRYKQGAQLEGIQIEKFYKTHFEDAIEHFVAEELLLDLRAGFYDKFYKPKREFVTMKFIKGGKVVSHFAKAYRGKVLRTLALQEGNITSFQILKSIHFEGIELIDEIVTKNKIELIYESVE